MQTIVNLWTTAELKLGAFCGVLWSIFCLAVGGMDAPLTALSFLVIGDFITGMLAGWHTDSWSSQRGRRGLLKKASIFAVVMMGYGVDIAMQMTMLRNMFISGFAIIEALSIIENLDRCGMGAVIPEFIRVKLQQIKEEKKV